MSKLCAICGHYTLIAAVNPCPYGFYGDPLKPCTCSHATVTKNQKRISGPLLDRIDIHIEVPCVEYEKLSDQRLGEPSTAIQARVETARDRQRQRFYATSSEQGTSPQGSSASQTVIACNADMRVAEVRKFCPLDEASRALMMTNMQQLQLSAGSYYQVLKLARTIADLAGGEAIQSQLLAEVHNTSSNMLV